MDQAGILDFWFGTLDRDGLADAAHVERWWRKDPDFDAEIEKRFAASWHELTRGEGGAPDTPEARLATVIVLDQFSRNMFRGQARAFSADEQALSLARAGVENGADRLLPGHMRVFLYMPFMHSEALDDQERCVALFAAYRDAAQGRLREALNGNVRFAQQHRDIIARFGRFPHRNEVLGRTSSADELAFLQQPGSSF